MTPRKCSFYSQGSKIVGLNNDFAFFQSIVIFFVSNIKKSGESKRVARDVGKNAGKSVSVAVRCSAATMLTHQVGTSWPNSFQTVAVRGSKRKISWLVLLKGPFYPSCIAGVWNQTVIEKLAFAKIKVKVVAHQSCPNYIDKSLFHRRRLQLSQLGILEHAPHATVSRLKLLFHAWVWCVW